MTILGSAVLLPMISPALVCAALVGPPAADAGRGTASPTSADAAPSGAAAPAAAPAPGPVPGGTGSADAERSAPATDPSTAPAQPAPAQPADGQPATEGSTGSQHFPVPTGAPHDRVGPPPANQPRSGASGVGAVTPLPPPPPAVPPRRILTKPWRGDGFLTMKLTVVGSLGGNGDLRGNLGSLGGAVEGGWRINNYLALGGGLSRNLHVRTRRVFYDSYTGDGYVYADTAGMTHFDFAFLRGYAPVKGRAQPWLDVGGGLALRDAVDIQDARAGASVRATLGFDGWVARNTSIQLGLQYRLIAAPGSVAHTLGGSVGLAFHW